MKKLPLIIFILFVTFFGNLNSYSQINYKQNRETKQVSSLKHIFNYSEFYEYDYDFKEASTISKINLKVLIDIYSDGKGRMVTQFNSDEKAVYRIQSCYGYKEYFEYNCLSEDGKVVIWRMGFNESGSFNKFYLSVADNKAIVFTN